MQCKCEVRPRPDLRRQGAERPNTRRQSHSQSLIPSHSTTDPHTETQAAGMGDTCQARYSENGERDKMRNPSANKQTTALKLAIEVLERERRRYFAAGEAAYNQGIRTDKIDTEGMKGDAFTFAEKGHAEYVRYTKAIQELADLIEIVNDEGTTIEQPSLVKE